MKKHLELEVCGGCNAKIGAGSLDQILKKLDVIHREDCIVGFDGKDDACVIKVNDELSIIQTVDFFPTMVKDPYLFGQIAAANAMSDIYAMGGDVISGLNIVCFPEGEDLDILEAILAGGALKMKEAGAVIAGGHSIHDPKIKYGLSCMGYVPTNKIWRNKGAQIGDRLILTKPLGVSLLMSAHSVGMAKDEDFDRACYWMKTLNRESKEIMEDFDIHAATDITGFGLLGHLDEFLEEGHCALVTTDTLGILPGAYEAAEEFLYTAGGQKNRKFMEGKVQFKFEDPALEEVLFDPQTSGGLLFAVSPKEENSILDRLQAGGIEAFQVGEIIEGKEHKIIVI